MCSRPPVCCDPCPIVVPYKCKSSDVYTNTPYKLECVLPSAACTNKQCILAPLPGDDNVVVGYTRSSNTGIVRFEKVDDVTNTSPEVIHQYTPVTITYQLTEQKIGWIYNFDDEVYYLVWAVDLPSENKVFYINNINPGESKTCDPRTHCTQTFIQPALGVYNPNTMPFLSLITQYTVPALEGAAPNGSVILSLNISIPNTRLTYWYINSLI